MAKRSKVAKTKTVTKRSRAAKPKATASTRKRRSSSTKAATRAAKPNAKPRRAKASPTTARTKPKRHGDHPKHEVCPGPGPRHALYKTMIKGKAVRKTDPWAFCRRESCPLWGQDQSKLTAEEIGALCSAPKPVTTMPTTITQEVQP